MPTAENAKLQYENSRTAVAMAALTDSGDHTVFTSSGGPWSRFSGSEPVVRPNGVINGGAVIPAVAAGNNNVDVAALLCNLNGVETSVAADTDVAITRPATAVSKVNSITVSNAGAIAVVAGADGATTAFSETRGANGGPPYIPTDSIEIAQVRVISDTDAVITAAQIFAQPGTHCEKAYDPTYTIDYENGKITFDAALPAIHTGDLAKAVQASYATASFGTAQAVHSFVPAETSASVSTTQFYGGQRAATSTSLGQASFTALLDDGVGDAFVQNKGEILCFKFFPDRLKAPYIFTQGRIDIARSFPVADNINVKCTVSAETAGTEHVV